MTPHRTGHLPLVQIGTENDSEPPLIIEDPCCYPFSPGERGNYRVATENEYRRYTEHYGKEEQWT